MVGKRPKSANLVRGGISSDRIHKVIIDARKNQEIRALGYREQSLKIHPWVCGRCRREFNRQNLSELTVHHKDHNHDNNPPDGSNWELLCIYCHDNEHARFVNQVGSDGLESEEEEKGATHSPFANLKELMKSK